MIITDYELWIDNGDVTSAFSKVESYDFATHDFNFIIDAASENLVAGKRYRF